MKIWNRLFGNYRSNLTQLLQFTITCFLTLTYAIPTSFAEVRNTIYRTESTFDKLHEYQEVSNTFTEHFYIQQIYLEIIKEHTVTSHKKLISDLKFHNESLKRFVHTAMERFHILLRTYEEAYRHDLKPSLLLSLIEVESHFNHFAISSAGALGLMQIMPFWKKEIGRKSDDLHDIDTNIRYGSFILNHYIDRSKGNLIEALARYNGSYGRYTYPRKIINAWRSSWTPPNTTDHVLALVNNCKRSPTC